MEGFHRAFGFGFVVVFVSQRMEERIGFWLCGMDWKDWHWHWHCHFVGLHFLAAVSSGVHVLVGSFEDRRVSQWFQNAGHRMVHWNTTVTAMIHW